MKKVALVLGSDSDWPIVKPACTQLELYGIAYEVRVLSAHRTPEEAADYAEKARENGFGVIICAAGAFAAHTTLPVIGIPVKGGMLDGLDALLSTIQMPPGIPVAAVTVNGAKNAAILAAEILAISDDALALKLSEERENIRRQTLEKDAKLREEIEK